MAAGKLKQKLHFQTRAMVDDGAGNEQAGDWETQFTEMAELIPLKGSESVIASRLAGVQPYIVRVRSNSSTRTIETGWRALDARNMRRALNIRSIADFAQDNAYLDMMADDGVAT